MSWRGEPLPPALRRLLEGHYGADLAAVRLHGGALAGWVTAAIGARAFVLGRRIFFTPRGWRMLRSGGPEGVVLVAHEVAHVLQYRRDGLLPMLVRYGGEYLAGRLRGRSHHAAYRGIGYEAEAYAAGGAVAERLRREGPEAGPGERC